MDPRAPPMHQTDRMLPTVLLAGLLIGRWWFVPAGGFAWVVLLVGANDLGLAEVPIAAALAMANAAIGVAGHKVIVLAVGHVRGQSLFDGRRRKWRSG